MCEWLSTRISAGKEPPKSYALFLQSSESASYACPVIQENERQWRVVKLLVDRPLCTCAPRDSLPTRMFSKGPMHNDNERGGRGWESIKFILTRNPFEGREWSSSKMELLKEGFGRMLFPHHWSAPCHAAAILKMKEKKRDAHGGLLCFAQSELSNSQ